MPADRSVDILSVGDRVRRGDYVIHSRFRRAVNFLGERGMVSLVAPVIGEGPFNIVLDHLPSDPGRRLRITEEAIETAAWRLPRPRDRVYASRPFFPAPAPQNLPGRLRELRRALLELSPDLSLAFLLDGNRAKRLKTALERAFLNRIDQGVKTLLNGDLEKGVKTLKGVGFGLTPSGDDFLAGVLVGLNLRQSLEGSDLQKIRYRIWSKARGSNPLVNLFLDMARDFSLPRRLKELAETLGADEPAGVYSRASFWLRQGATSPADLAAGIYLTLKEGEQLCS